MKIKWQIEDGYVGKSRPHYCEIPDEELEDLEGDEREAFIIDWVEEEFKQAVSFSFEIVG